MVKRAPKRRSKEARCLAKPQHRHQVVPSRKRKILERLAKREAGRVY